MNCILVELGMEISYNQSDPVLVIVVTEQSRSLARLAYHR